MHYKKQNGRCRRSPSGQTLAAGVSFLYLMTLLFVCFVSLILFIGSYVHNTIKLSHAAKQAALYGMNQMYYAGCPRPKQTESAVAAKVSDAMKAIVSGMGFPGAIIEFRAINIDGANCGEATVAAASVPIPGGGPILFGTGLPGTLNISQTEIQTGAVPPYIACIAAAGGSNASSGCVQVPCIAPAQPFNFGSAPAYFSGSFSVPGASVRSAPGYCWLILNATTNSQNCRVLRQPYSTGPGWAY